MLAHQTLSDYGAYIIPRLGRRFYNKFEAIMTAESCGEWVEWDFNDAYFSQFRWDVEPPESLDALYEARARELREKYDYLVLHLSGGWDSGNALEAFMRADVPLDEIITRGPIPDIINPLDTSAANNYAECIIAAKPKAEIAKRKWPNMHFTIADTKQLAIDYYSRDKDWFYKMNQVYIGVHRFDLDLLSPHATLANQSGKSVCHIISVDKPRLQRVNGRYHWRFLDLLVQIHLAERLSAVDLPMCVEMFYWAPTPAAVNVMIKQGHTMKRYYSASNIDPNSLSWGRETQDATAGVIYPSMRLPVWNTQKPSAIHEADHWFYKDANSDHCVNWMKGIEHMSRVIPDRYRKPGGAAFEMTGFWSKSYDLGP